MAPPPLPEDHRDAEHVRLLSIFHYVAAGLGVAGLIGLALHFLIMRSFLGVMNNLPRNAPAKETKQPVAEPMTDPITGEKLTETMPEVPVENVADVEIHPEVFTSAFSFLGLFYLVFGAFIIVKIVMNLMSARYLGQRKNKVFSMVTAALNCLSVPLGTILGVFTLIVLSRQSVDVTYRKVAGLD